MGFFKKREEKIQEFIESNINQYLEAENVKNFDKYVNDFLNLDKYKYSKTLFYNFGNYDLTPYSNESENGNFVFDIFMVFRNDAPENLRKEMLGTADAFYSLLHDDTGFNFGGAVDQINDVAVSFYNAADGDINLKIAAFTFSTGSEF